MHNLILTLSSSFSSVVNISNKYSGFDVFPDLSFTSEIYQCTFCSDSLNNYGSLIFNVDYRPFVLETSSKHPTSRMSSPQVLEHGMRHILECPFSIFL